MYLFQSDVCLQALGLQVKGHFVEGERISAVFEYCGGVQAAAGSEYSWVRVRSDGKREIVESACTEKLLLTAVDIGCTMKVKCRPMREDGVKGEIATSKPSMVVTAVDEGTTQLPNVDKSRAAEEQGKDTGT
jgi:hypothetical protein